MPPRKKKAKTAKNATVSETERGEVTRRKDCPDCGSMNINFDPETEQMICQDCGVIFAELPEDLGKRYDELDFL